MNAPEFGGVQCGLVWLKYRVSLEVQGEENWQESRGQALRAGHPSSCGEADSQPERSPSHSWANLGSYFSRFQSKPRAYGAPLVAQLVQCGTLDLVQVMI